MGSGKTTAGKKLAARLGWNFIDLDREIEKREGMSIPEIFSLHGESGFRKSEEEALRETAGHPRSVIATGGGAPCFGSNMDFIISSGITVYLKLSPRQLMDRLLKSKTVRPLLKDLDSEGLLKFIQERLPEREKYYSRAEIILEGCDLNMETLLERISLVT